MPVKIILSIFDYTYSEDQNNILSRLRCFMSRKQLFIAAGVFLLLINGSILGTLYFAGIIGQPSQEELLALKAEEEAAANALKYAHLEPLAEFKSKADYVANMGEAISICEAELHIKELATKSWAVNHIESRYVASTEMYMVFIDYETVVGIGETPKAIKVTCEVEEATKLVANWMAQKAG